ncbi:MAG: bifunctional folylpolyglutamate synthase/dihydrofolate synthase [Vicinamibacteria bacterium]|nr:bifunctional folylpolyglutamate synthase/dihydrofolate synthase [Vicinamibacteria bacterium]
MGPFTWLRSRARFGIKLGLGPLRQLMRALGRPERCAPALLVAGTNGKGSVVALLDAGLRAGGLRVGRYTSPHLVRPEERITVDGRPVATRVLARALSRVREVSEALVARGALPAAPTYFEAITAAAWLIFRDARVDVQVLEVGLGGRLDATNLSDPRVSAIVSLGLDHQEYLGPTLRHIAREKAGVMRRGRPTVIGALPAEATAVIVARARASGARLVDAEADVRLRPLASRPRRGQPRALWPARLDATTPHARHRGVQALPGPHQSANLKVALRVLEEAHASGLRFDLARAVAGFATAHWPGRLEWIAGRPPLLLDGAHNVDGARALAAALAPLRSCVLLFGAMADKDLEQVTAALFPLAREVVLVKAPGARAASPATIARRAGAVATRARRARSLRAGLALAAALARRGEPVVVAGSLYLVGAVLAHRAGTHQGAGESSGSSRARKSFDSRSSAPIAASTTRPARSTR